LELIDVGLVSQDVVGMDSYKMVLRPLEPVVSDFISHAVPGGLDTIISHQEFFLKSPCSIVSVKAFLVNFNIFVNFDIINQVFTEVLSDMNSNEFIENDIEEVSPEEES